MYKKYCYTIKCEKSLLLLLARLLNKIKKYKYHIFIADIGAGKTTIIKNILYLLGVNTVITSATFNYLKIINCNLGKAAHIDLYRINDKNMCIEIIEAAKEENTKIYFIENGNIITNTVLYETIIKQTILWNIQTFENNKTIILRTV